MRLEKVMMMSLIILAALFTVRVVNNAYYQSDRRFIKFGLGLETHAHPVKASAFLNENGLDGRLLNDLNTGAYFGWKLKQKIFIDGRLEVMREEFFGEYKKGFAMGGLKTLIEKYQPQIIAFDYVASLIWNQQLRQMDDWRLIHLDETTAVYAHKTYAQHLPSISFKEALNRLNLPESFSEQERNELLSLPEPSRFEKWLSGFWRTQPYPYQLMELGVYCYQNGDAPAAERCYLQYIKETNGELAESYFNIGSLYYRAKETTLARYCYEKFIRMGGTHPLAQKRLLELGAK
jgi:tetratricopeptide (TPR) repeat protein